eukprot:CAMPEP_0197548062 /NCGR_PEP_ID=MMETSP1320-20131121/2262_1 /TAXON_ID=91990 /ORGANISM="Bolidomonas sp., Strain RCC2347" /LENGTH=564 /DNA_ID=CAMNT_0043107987 /DNA_START=18 /DNA_END=1709 /DNA_ORIENTATION=-
MPRRRDDSSVESEDDNSSSAPPKKRAGKAASSDSEDEPGASKQRRRPTLKLGRNKKDVDDDAGDDDEEGDSLLKKRGGKAASGTKKGLFSGWGAKKGSNSDDEDENEDPNQDDSDDDDDLEKGNAKKKKKKKKQPKKQAKRSRKKHHESNHKHSLELIKDGLVRFAPSDKDIKGKPIHISEAPLFVKANFGDGSGPATLTDLNDLLRDVEDEKSRSKSSPESVYVYIESASTGRFFRFLSNGLDRISSSQGETNLQDLPDDDFDGSREAAMQRLERLFFTGFLIIQGLLAGYSGETVYAAFTSTTEANFVAEYATLSNETRRFYYILTTLAFVGAMNNWRSTADSNEAWRSRSFVEKAELLFLVLIYVAGLCFTLVAGVYDMDFYYHNGVKDSEVPTDQEWYDVALQDTSFKDSINKWRLLTTFRFISVMVGWLVVCRILHRNSARSAEAIRESENLKHTLELARNRINQLTGAKLDKMAREELRELALTQRSALEQTEHVLETLPKEPADAFAPMTTPRGGGGFDYTGGLSMGTGGGLSMGSPTRGRTSSTLPASISSKAPPA